MWINHYIKMYQIQHLVQFCFQVLFNFVWNAVSPRVTQITTVSPTSKSCYWMPEMHQSVLVPFYLWTSQTQEQPDCGVCHSSSEFPSWFDCITRLMFRVTALGVCRDVLSIEVEENTTIFIIATWISPILKTLLLHYKSGRRG